MPMAQGEFGASSPLRDGGDMPVVVSSEDRDQPSQGWQRMVRAQ